MLRQLRLRLNVSLREALYIVGTDAKRAPGGDAVSSACERVAALVGETRVDVEVPAAHLLCQACDEYRKRDDAEAVAAIEGLIRELKAGRNARIVGRLAFGVQSAGQIDDALETMRKVAIAKSEG